MLAHGANRSFVGKQWIDVKDPDGKPFIKEMVDAANQKGNGWVEYSWYDPEIKETLPKAVYFEKVDDVDHMQRRLQAIKSEPALNFRHAGTKPGSAVGSCGDAQFGMVG